MTARDSSFSAGTEAPVSRSEEDLYGFENVAAGLSRSILALDNNVSTVIGIEGKWGAGKTSLLRLLMNRLEEHKPAGTHVLHIAPWLTAQGTSPADSLLMPVAAILRKEEEDRQPQPQNLWQACQRHIRKSHEPETHLHPPLVASFLKALKICLESLNGCAIITTHSPVVLQETPSEFVNVLVNDDLSSKLVRPDIETFAENVSIITQEVFGLDDGYTDWHDTLKQIIDQNPSVNVNEKFFNNKLGFTARSYIASYMKSKG